MGVSRPSGMSRRNSEAGVRTRGNSLMSEEEEAKQARREARRKKREAAAAEQSRAPSKVVDEEDDAARRARRAERKARKEAELRAAEPKARSRKIDVNEQDYQVLEEERAKKEEKRRKREAVDRALDERQRRKEKHRSPEPERSSRRRPEAEIRHTHATYEDPEEDRRARRERRASRDVSNARPKQERRRTAPANDFMDADVTKDPDAFRHLKGQDIPREVGGKKHMSKWINSLEREPPEPPPIEGTVLDESGQKPRKVHEFEDEEIREKERRRERRKSTREPVQAESGKDRSRHRRPKSSYVHGYGDEDGLHRDGSSGSPNGIDEPDFGGGGGGRTRRTVGRRDSYVDAGVVDEAEDAYRTAENGVPESKLGKSSWWKGARAKMGIN